MLCIWYRLWFHPVVRHRCETCFSSTCTRSPGSMYPHTTESAVVTTLQLDVTNSPLLPVASAFIDPTMSHSRLSFMCPITRCKTMLSTNDHVRMSFRKSASVRVFTGSFRKFKFDWSRVESIVFFRSRSVFLIDRSRKWNFGHPVSSKGSKKRNIRQSGGQGYPNKRQPLPKPQKASHRDASLRFATLRDASRRFATLRFASRRFATLRFASLRIASHRFASLRPRKIGAKFLFVFQ